MSRTLQAERFYTILQIAELLHVHERTVRRWIDKEKLRAHEFGAVIRIVESDLRAFLAAHRR
jgi:excisionase family DNA binding protein